MTTDTLYEQLRGHLHYLKLAAIADALTPALEHAERDRPGYTEFLHALLKAEVDATEQRRLQGRLRFSKLPARKTLDQFDHDAQPSLDRRMIDELATLRFIAEQANVLLIGPPGVGKTHLAVAPRPSRPATASTTPPPPTSSPAPAAPRSKGAGRPRCASGTDRSSS